MPKKIKYKDWSQEKKDRQTISIKKWREKNKERHLAYIKKYSKEYRKKNLEILRIKNKKWHREHSTSTMKGGWDAKKWYKGGKYTHCIECGTNKRPYRGKGLCNLCYERTRKEYKAKWFQEQQKKKKRSARK